MIATLRNMVCLVIHRNVMHRFRVQEVQDPPLCSSTACTYSYPEQRNKFLSITFFLFYFIKVLQQRWLVSRMSLSAVMTWLQQILYLNKVCYITQFSLAVMSWLQQILYLNKVCYITQFSLAVMSWLQQIFHLQVL